MSIRARLASAAAATCVVFAGTLVTGTAVAHADVSPGGITSVPSLPGSGHGVMVEGPGYTQLSPALGNAIDRNGPRLPDGLRLPQLPGDGLFWHTAYFKDVPHPVHGSIEHAGMYFVPVDRSSDWTMVVTEIDAASTDRPVARLYMFCNMSRTNNTAESLTPYTDRDGTLAFDQSISGGGSFARDYIAWVHRFAWNAL